MTAAFAHPDNQRISVARWMVAATQDEDGQANWTAAALLAQITWWSALNERTGRPRMSHQHVGTEGYWLVRTDDEWAEELGISGKTVARARKRLEQRGLIETRRMREQGRTLMHWRRAAASPDTLSSQETEPLPDTLSISQPDTLGGSQPDKEGSSSAAALFIGEKVSKDLTEKMPRREVDERFDAHFWPAYPARDGKKIGKRQALEQWRKMSLDEQRAAVRGVGNYAAHVNAGNRYAKDAFRWLRDHGWEDWQTPAAPPPVGNGKPGQGTTNDYLAKARAIYERDGA